jgi:hypothetical protein
MDSQAFGFRHVISGADSPSTAPASDQIYNHYPASSDSVSKHCMAYAKNIADLGEFLTAFQENGISDSFDSGSTLELYKMLPIARFILIISSSFSLRLFLLPLFGQVALLTTFHSFTERGFFFSVHDLY